LNQQVMTVPRARQLMIAAFTALAGLGAGAAKAGPDVGVSVEISQPGVYGRVDIGRFPQPQVVVAQPVIIARPHVRPEPVYMWVPPGHRKKWSRYCGRYQACGVPVYFVQDRWYHEHVRDRHEERREERHDHRHDGGRGSDRHGGDDHGQGRGHGEGRGRGH